MGEEVGRMFQAEPRGTAGDNIGGGPDAAAPQGLAPVGPAGRETKRGSAGSIETRPDKLAEAGLTGTQSAQGLLTAAPAVQASATDAALAAGYSPFEAAQAYYDENGNLVVPSSATQAVEEEELFGTPLTDPNTGETVPGSGGTGSYGGAGNWIDGQFQGGGNR